MANVVTIDAAHANSIAGIMLAAINKGLIDPVVGHQLRKALRAATERVDREFVELVAVPGGGVAAVVALCDDGSIFLTVDIRATPIVWIPRGIAPQDPVTIAGVCTVRSVNTGTLQLGFFGMCTARSVNSGTIQLV